MCIRDRYQRRVHGSELTPKESLFQSIPSSFLQRLTKGMTNIYSMDDKIDPSLLAHNLGNGFNHKKRLKRRSPYPDGTPMAAEKLYKNGLNLLTPVESISPLPIQGLILSTGVSKFKPFLYNFSAAIGVPSGQGLLRLSLFLWLKPFPRLWASKEGSILSSIEYILVIPFVNLCKKELGID
eukprot:TRINITY_DN62524_c0_g1_i1.p2 TRINITY_DN62524_c0_g1~~TRINITY_DN62524_c0_g1_i1.p2  ORF type:complete len:192 (-),score=8.81 TRINITY_DN62524_c0_g1_i1:105-647(-)